LSCISHRISVPAGKWKRKAKTGLHKGAVPCVHFSVSKKKYLRLRSRKLVKEKLKIPPT
jgi:hypothetical protein